MTRETTKKVTLYIVAGMDEENQRAQDLLEPFCRDTHRQFEIEVCSTTMGKMFLCPFIRDEEDGAHYGMDGIELFIERARVSTCVLFTNPDVPSNIKDCQERARNALLSAKIPFWEETVFWDPSQGETTPVLLVKDSEGRLQYNLDGHRMINLYVKSVTGQLTAPVR